MCTSSTRDTRTCTSRRCRKFETHCSNKKHIRIIAGDFDAQIGPGIDSERDHVGEHTKGQSNKRGIWVKQWLMMQMYVALRATFNKHQKSNTPPSGKEKRLDYIVTDRRNRRHCTDVEANDMIHLVSNHRSVTAHFLIRMRNKRIGEENRN